MATSEVEERILVNFLALQTLIQTSLRAVGLPDNHSFIYLSPRIDKGQTSFLRDIQAVCQLLHRFRRRPARSRSG